MNKWEGIVYRRRAAEQLTFPLKTVDLKVKNDDSNAKPIATTDLQKDIYKLFYGKSLTPSIPKVVVNNLMFLWRVNDMPAINEDIAII